MHALQRPLIGDLPDQALIESGAFVAQAEIRRLKDFRMALPGQLGAAGEQASFNAGAFGAQILQMRIRLTPGPGQAGDLGVVLGHLV